MANSLNGNGVILKGKTHIIDRKYKVNGFMKTINKQIQVEMGAGNNQINPKKSEVITYFKLENIGDMNIRVRFSKNGKEARPIDLGPNEKYNGFTVFFQGQGTESYALETFKYYLDMLSGFYEVQPLKYADYTNTEEHPDYDYYGREEVD